MLLQSQQTVVGQDKGHTLVRFPRPFKLIKQCSFTNAAYLMENYILKSSVDLGLGFIQLPSGTGQPLMTIW